MSPQTSQPSSWAKGEFAATRWSIVLAAADGRAGTGARKALEELFRIYWFPLYAFIRRQGSSPQQAEDLTQGFFLHLLEKERLAGVDRSRGKFRSFLLASLKNFIADQRDKALARKRGDNRQLVSLDALGSEARYAKSLADETTPQRLFERAWAIAVLEQVVSRLEKEYVDRGMGKVFRALRHTIDGQADSQGCADIARSLDMSEGAVRTAAHRMRRRYRGLLRDEILQTVDSPDLVDEEIQYLLRCL